MILIDGEPGDSVPVTDSSVLRGDGCFEAVKVYGTVPFALGPHLDRLTRSAKLLGMQLPERTLLETWVHDVADADPNSVIRIVVTRGGAVPGATQPGQTIVFSHPWGDRPSALRLAPIPAPWHSGGRPWDLTGAKTLSYAPNEAAKRRAEAMGFDDAVLLSDEGIILELPTSSVAWVVDGVVETPSLDLGILASITRDLVLDNLDRVGLRAVEGRWPLDRVNGATEVFVMSTTREIVPVTAVGDHPFKPGPITATVSQLYTNLTRGNP